MKLFRFKEDEKRKCHKKLDRNDVFCNVLMETMRRFLGGPREDERKRKKRRNNNRKTMLEMKIFTTKLSRTSKLLTCFGNELRGKKMKEVRDVSL
jgi:hypothetical protein